MGLVFVPRIVSVLLPAVDLFTTFARWRARSARYHFLLLSRVLTLMFVDVLIRHDVFDSNNLFIPDLGLSFVVQFDGFTNARAIEDTTRAPKAPWISGNNLSRNRIESG
jgi:hypothetical protein